MRKGAPVGKTAPIAPGFRAELAPCISRENDAIRAGSALQTNILPVYAQLLARVGGSHLSVLRYSCGKFVARRRQILRLSHGCGGYSDLARTMRDIRPARVRFKRPLR